MQFVLDVELSNDTIQKVEHDVQLMRAGIDASDTQNGGDGEEGNRQAKRITEKNLRYTLEIQMMTREGYLRVIDEKLVAVTKAGEEKPPTVHWSIKHASTKVIITPGRSGASNQL